LQKPLKATDKHTQRASNDRIYDSLCFISLPSPKKKEQSAAAARMSSRTRKKTQQKKIVCVKRAILLGRECCLNHHHQCHARAKTERELPGRGEGKQFLFIGTMYHYFCHARVSMQ
jgi:hypothetical protein